MRKEQKGSSLAFFAHLQVSMTVAARPPSLDRGAVCSDTTVDTLCRGEFCTTPLLACFSNDVDSQLHGRVESWKGSQRKEIRSEPKQKREVGGERGVLEEGVRNTRAEARNEPTKARPRMPSGRKAFVGAVVQRRRS